jgi:hypothetical protein
VNVEPWHRYTGSEEIVVHKVRNSELL